MSQLLNRRQRELLIVKDPLAKAELLARISGDLARTGRFDEARQCVAELRLQYADEKSGPATVWIMLAESLIYLFCDLSPLAMDRVKRAQILGQAMKYPAAIAAASAWRAHIEFENSLFEGMVSSIRLGFQHADADDHDSRVRLAMVLANAFMICGERANSEIWFKNARNHAVKNGDQASIEALLYNRTAFGIAIIRSDRCIGMAQNADLAIVRKEVESATNLQQLTRISALSNHIHLWGARLSILENNFVQGIEALARARQGIPFADYNFSQQMIDLEMAYCLARTGQIDKAFLIFDSIDLNSIECLDLDEKLVAASMQYDLELISSRFKREGDALGRLLGLKSQYLTNRDSLRNSLSEWAAI
jgi:hypothetical protein